MPKGMSGSDNSTAESLLPPPNLGRERSVASFRIDANRPDQSSAGKYPLISRPTQISTRVGVVHAIGRLARVLQHEQSKLGAAAAQASPMKNRTLAGPVTVRRRGGRQSPSRGEQLTALRLQSGRMGNRRTASDAQYAAAIFPHNAKGCMPAMRHS